MSDVILADRPVEVYSESGREVVRRSVHRVRELEDGGMVGRVRLGNVWRRVVRSKGKRTWTLS